jgi:hypothetical protein
VRHSTTQDRRPSKGACGLTAPVMWCCVQSRRCPTVVLTSTADGAYVLRAEIVVGRDVRVVGNALTLPFIAGKHTRRCFRVLVRTYGHRRQRSRLWS